VPYNVLLQLQYIPMVARYGIPVLPMTGDLVSFTI